jgi:hypothetical protein
VDEAAQALEAECLIPLSLAGSHTKIILSGDHMQVRDFHFYYSANLVLQWQFNGLGVLAGYPCYCFIVWWCLLV